MNYVRGDFTLSALASNGAVFLLIFIRAAREMGPNFDTSGGSNGMKSSSFVWTLEKTEGKLGANVMKRVAAGAHLPTPWLF